MGGKIFEGTRPVSREEAQEIIEGMPQLLQLVGVEGFEPLGSTGVKDESNDVDVAIRYAPHGHDTPEKRKKNKLELAENLKKIFTDDNVKISGQTVHVKLPFKDHFVQLDIMPVDNPRHVAWLMRGLYRNVMMSLVAKHYSEILTETTEHKWKITVGAPGGVQVKKDDEIVVVRTNDPEVILENLGMSYASVEHTLTLEDFVEQVNHSTLLFSCLRKFREYTKQFSARDDYEENLKIVEGALRL